MDTIKPDQTPGWILKTLKWAIIGILGFVYACLFGELFLRVMDPQVRMPRFITGTDYGIRGNIPNSVYRQVTPEVDVEMRINGQGMRSNRDFTEAKHAGTCRIALLGDSYFMGYEAHYEDTIGALLETRFEKLGRNVEVLNFAVSGFSTEEMLHEFEARTISYDPDIIVAQFGNGDFADNMRPGLFKLDDNGIPQPTGGTYLPGVEIRDYLMQFSFYRMLITSSHIYSGFREWAGQTVQKILTEVGNRTRREETAKAPPSTEAVNAFRKAQTRYTSALLMRSRERAEEEGMEWFVLDVPTALYKAYKSSAGELELDAATLDRLISPVDWFDKHPSTEPWLYREQGHSHFSPEGHDLATQALMDGMLSKTPHVFDRCPL